MRTIDADALVMEIIENPPVYNTNRVVDVIKSQPTVGGWISVEDKLPDSKEQVLIVFEWTGISGTKYREIALDSFKAMGFLGYKPLFWMPLPEPPEVSKNG